MTTTDVTGPLGWLASEPLAPVWDAVRRRLERNGLVVTGQTTITLTSAEQRRAVSGLLAMPVTTSRVRVDLAELDTKLRASAASLGLVAVVEHVAGPLTDRKANRVERAEQRTALWAHTDIALAEAGLGEEQWIPAWLDDLRLAGTLTRLGDRGQTAVDSAVAALAAITGPDPDVPVARGVLAQRVSGSAHGLDDNTMLGRIVLRALAHALGAQAPTSAAERRTIWRVAGVSPDEISTTVVTAGLRPAGNLWSDLLRQRTDAGAETHLDDREIERIAWQLPAGTVIHVCENPRVIEEVIDAGITAPVVCTLGNPTTVASSLMAALRAAGARLRYHGDFDWAGVAIAGRMFVLGCEPWRMSAQDYEDAAELAEPVAGDLPPLIGPIVATPWDRELSAAMVAIGRAVHEEALVETLLGDLSRV